jgi:hypothetical protein
MAEFWLRKACQLANSKDEEAAILFQKVRVYIRENTKKCMFI